MDKTFVYEPNSNGGNDWGSGAWSNPLWALIFLAYLGNNGFGGGNRNANTDFVAS